MSCPYCKHNGTDEEYLNEPIVSRDGLHVSMLYENTLAVWLPLEDGVLAIKALVPINYCPVCGRRLGAEEG